MTYQVDKKSLQRTAHASGQKRDKLLPLPAAKSISEHMGKIVTISDIVALSVWV